MSRPKTWFQVHLTMKVAGSVTRARTCWVDLPVRKGDIITLKGEDVRWIVHSVFGRSWEKPEQVWKVGGLS